MRPILIYAGTTEGRRLAEHLAAAGIPCIVSVATEYGRQTMPDLPGISVREGRLDVQQMRRLAEKENPLAVVDATHPFATEATKNIRASVEGIQGMLKDGTVCEIPYLRLLRRTGSGITEDRSGREKGSVRWFADSSACARALRSAPGNILLTTGSKELSVYAAEEQVRKRLYVRVLPGPESMGICETCGIAGRQIIAMQGPFSQELNEALIHQLDIRILVTKESGAAGGYPEKLAAAEHTGIQAFVIGNLEQPEGDSFGQVLKKLGALTGKDLSHMSRHQFEIDLVGVGMGERKNRTMEVQAVLEKADYVFGASRMILDIPAEKNPKPYYLAGDILPELERIRTCPGTVQNGVIRIAVLFSGDTGFYSGCKRMREKLTDAGYAKVRIHPGISSVSYMAAACRTSWQDASVMSIHGKGDAANWMAQVVESVRYHEKTFLLVSGAGDVRALGVGLTEWGLEHCRIFLGYQLSYPEENVRELTPSGCSSVEAEGLYICLIRNPQWEKRPLTQGLADDSFLRDKVPMTKEEIRETVISKLHLKEQDVVYDVGSGTGSVAVEIAARSAGLTVYAIEKKPLAAELIRQNCRKHRVPNVRVIQGEAPEALEELETPDCAFIGGSSGNLREILSRLYRKNPSMRVVLTAISLETVAQIPEILEEFALTMPEIVQMQVSRGKAAGRYHLMQAENPVYIVSFTFTGRG